MALLILGRSFVRCIRNHKVASRLLPNNLNLAQYQNIIYYGIGGYKIKYLWEKLVFISNISLNEVLLDIGSNDLCDINTTPENFVSELLEFIKHLKNELHIPAVVVMQLFVRGSKFNPRNHQRSISEIQYGPMEDKNV
jgi:hypothetical protein